MSRSTSFRRRLLDGSAVLAAMLCLAGCAAPAGEDVLRVEPGRYAAAFDASLEVARANGLPAAMRDRRAGVIETDADIAASFLEPWRLDGASIARRFENTLALQRRRARFEFIPAGFRPEAAGGPAPLTGPDVLGLQPMEEDLTRLDEPLELRVRVYLERAHKPGLRHDTWTRRKTTRTQILGAGEDPQPLEETYWTPVARDRDFERRLLAAIERMLAKQEPPRR
jgi:hypothetical protein